ncbi:MAG TPA: hypothetical protein VFI34_11410 [Candidatus Limnocylindrales bacterium]|nr:hypothetical protein [Candidatus Limnocylindrales bacterium]
MTDEFDRAASFLEGREFGELAGDSLAGAERQIVDDVAERVRGRARRHRKSGQMERRIRVKVSGEGEAQTAQVHAGGKVAHLIAGGTRAHAIVAKAKPLPWGPRSFAESVHHPRTRPDPFFAAAVDDSTPDIAAALDDAGADLVRQLATRLEG